MASNDISLPNGGALNQRYRDDEHPEFIFSICHNQSLEVDPLKSRLHYVQRGLSRIVDDAVFTKLQDVQMRFHHELLRLQELYQNDEFKALAPFNDPAQLARVLAPHPAFYQLAQERLLEYEGHFKEEGVRGERFARDIRSSATLCLELSQAAEAYSQRQCTPETI